MTDDDARRALHRAEFEARKLAAEVDKLKYHLRKMRQELRAERAEHRITALKLEASLAWGRGPIGVPEKNPGS